MRRSRRTAVAMGGVLVFVLAACGGDGEPTGADDTATAGDPAQAAVRDAAERADVDPDAVEVVTHEQVTWPDGALGCPDDGQFYTQALVEGYRLVIEAGGQTLHYHGETGGDPQFCADPEPPAETGATGTDDP